MDDVPIITDDGERYGANVIRRSPVGRVSTRTPRTSLLILRPF
jgi:hypothetical protein